MASLVRQLGYGYARAMEKVSAQVFDGTGTGEIRVTCEGAALERLADLFELQGELKSLSEENYGRLKREIIQRGFSFPVATWRDSDGKLWILDGHQRTRVLRQLENDGWQIPSVPVVYVEAASLEEAKGKLLAAASQYGKLEEQGLYQFMSQGSIDLNELVDRFTFPDIDVPHFEASYFGDPAPAAGGKDGADPDAVPEPDEKKEPITQLGDIWELGEHRLMCGDARDAESVALLMDGQRADMVWTDPPYNVAYEGKTKDALTIENDSMNDESFYSFLFAAYTSMLGHTRAGGAIYVAHADSEGANFRRALQRSGWLLKQCLIWVKNSLVMGRQDYHWKHEPILYGWAPGAAHTWETDRKQTTVLEFDRPTRSTDHPTMKPVALVEYMVKNSSKPGDIVMDLFGGSGTTMIAAQQCSRRARLMELSPIYCDVIVRRFEEFTGQTAKLATSRDVTLRNRASQDADPVEP